MQKKYVNSFLKIFSKSRQIANKNTKFNISIAMNKIFMKKIIEIEKLFASTTNIKNDVTNELITKRTTKNETIRNLFKSLCFVENFSNFAFSHCL